MKKAPQDNPQKKKMLAIASVLFWEKGYHGTSMRDISESYDCKPANIYNFFKNKETILYEFLLEQMKILISQIKHLEEDQTLNPIEQLRYLISKHLTQVLSYSKSSRFLFDVGLGSLSPGNRKKIVNLRDTYDRILCRVIQRGIDIGEFNNDLDAKLAAYNIASMIVRSVIWFSPQGNLSVEQVSNFILNFALNGLRGEKRLKKTGSSHKRVDENEPLESR
jgi:TetR/AcrR family transcriptional regulator, cholesterol catabolism regulator